ncbi:hypothetical protein CRUP_008582 [Coryphaenoides rupestris]|nr:hypothetical protein CRUP_008582 [Coryphaenoides rupestris]
MDVELQQQTIRASLAQQRTIREASAQQRTIREASAQQRRIRKASQQTDRGQAQETDRGPVQQTTRATAAWQQQTTRAAVAAQQQTIRAAVAAQQERTTTRAAQQQRTTTRGAAPQRTTTRGAAPQRTTREEAPQSGPLEEGTARRGEMRPGGRGHPGARSRRGPTGEAPGVRRRRSLTFTSSSSGGESRALFTYGDNETPARSVYRIPGVSAEAMQLLVEYAYTCHVEVSWDNVELLLEAADQFSVMGAVDACGDYLAGQLSVENAVGIWRITGHYMLLNRGTATAPF